MAEALDEQTATLSERLKQAYLDEAGDKLFYNNSGLYTALHGLQKLIRSAMNQRHRIIFNSDDGLTGVRKNYSGVEHLPDFVLPAQTPLVLSRSFESPLTFTACDYVEKLQVGDTNFLVRGMRVAQALSNNGSLFVASKEQAEGIGYQTTEAIEEILS